MLRGFGIRVVPCRFRQDSRDYYIDCTNNAISDVLHSFKHISKRVSDALYEMKDESFEGFTGVLYR